MKYSRRKTFRMYRQAGLPFMAAQRLAKLYQQGRMFYSDVEAAMAKEGIKVSTVTYCECCGPEGFALEWKDKRVVLGYFSLAVL